MDWMRGTAVSLAALLSLNAFANTQKFKRLVVVVLENTDLADAQRQPFLTDLARRGALLTNFDAIAHPSQPNYIAMIAGSTLGVRSDSKVNLNDSHLGDLLEANGRDWKVYAERFPGNCYAGNKKGYVRKHNPFISFLNVQNSANRCARIVDATEFDADARAGKLPDYSMYVPDMSNNGHDTDVRYADRWLTKTFQGWLNDPAFTRDTLFVVTFDENAGSRPNRIYTALMGASVRAGAVSASHYTHYSLLRTIEDEFGLGSLGREDMKAVPISDIWR